MKIETIDLKIDSLILLAIISNLQLALTHPQNVGESAKMIRLFIEDISKALSQIDPVYKILIDAGVGDNRSAFN